MKMQEVREKAKTLGLNTFGKKKVDLIRAIQNKEENVPCFQTGLDSCDQFSCCWRSDCFPVRTTEKNEASERESYLKKVKDELEEFNNKIDDLKEKTKRMVGKTKADALEEIKRLEKKSEVEIKQKMHKLAEASEDVWQTAKKGIDSSWKDLREAFKKALSRHSSMKK
jgi:phenylalanyl-tRNA synthetase alpha subunit